MKKSLFIVPIIFIALFFIGYSFTYSYFSNTGSSSNNTFAAAVTFPISPTPTLPVAQYLVISEVQTNGGTGGGQDKLTDRDFVEIYNPTNSTVNLGDYKLVKKTGAAIPSEVLLFDYTNSHIIPAYGFFL